MELIEEQKRIHFKSWKETLEELETDIQIFRFKNKTPNSKIDDVLREVSLALEYMDYLL